MTAGILGEPLRVINRLVAEGLLLDCAICGGVAALYYTEPVLTYDFDVLCRFPALTALIDPTPVYARLKEWGYSFGFEDRVTIAGIPVQFIAAAPGLMEEALDQAVPVTICGVGTRVLRAEHLAAIMLDLYRPKDRAKLSLLVDNDAVVFDGALFAALLERYGLEAKWRRCHEE
jgi:hypothetical protein